MLGKRDELARAASHEDQRFFLGNHIRRRRSERGGNIAHCQLREQLSLLLAPR
jgi:hypothetical protein